MGTVRAIAVCVVIVVAGAACNPPATVTIPAADGTPPDVFLDVYGVPQARNSGQSVEPVSAVAGQQRSVNIPSLTELTAIATSRDSESGMWFLEMGFIGQVHCDGSVSSPGFGDWEYAPGFPAKSGWQAGTPLPAGFPATAPVSLTNTIKVVRSLTNCNATGRIIAFAVNATGGRSQQAVVLFESSP